MRPQAQLGFESPDCSVDVSDDTPPSRQQQVHRIVVARDVTQVCSVFPSAFHELTDLLAQFKTPFQDLCPAWPLEPFCVMRQVTIL